ncbi:RNA polymerase, 25-kDa subunit (common to polymerases I, II and III) [Handroanthus impetiginosus]|uniref:RNA polymerase, 25-kDa subunit (Common to polymerases I, II and III) n=1 Tax=Handroanthus impetiginosus TaxID=429701 RepID=A0A2G9GVT5_9LAMI|nr:RNA polymerase, 25-kDa subunit (common to polymerases I, II and III) [Handroanthus impetiginosus]
MADSTGNRVCLASMVENGSMESRRYYLARRTLIEMLRDRGYVVANMEEELRRSLTDFRAAYGDKPEPERLRLFAGRATSLASRKILVMFSEIVVIKKQNMIGILSQIMNKEMLEKVILIVQGKINSHAQKVLDEYPVKVETFHITELLVNITKHYLAPKHEILTPDEKEKLLKKYSIEGKQLPMMLENDAIARYYGLEKGQVVKVTYSGGIPDSTVTYRCVV